VLINEDAWISRIKNDFDIAVAKETITMRERSRAEARHERLEKACEKLEKIVAHIIQKYEPMRVYQWGSLLDERRFTKISDIDIAL